MSQNEDNFEVMSCIETLFKIAANNDQRGENSLSGMDVRTRATLALAAFLPIPQAKRHLFSLVASSEVPIEIRSVASQSMNGNGRP